MTYPGKRAVLVSSLTALAALSTVASPALASPYTTPCSIAKWNYKDAQARMVSGGCTCHVAERVGRDIPWSGNAGQWWANATWQKNEQEPRASSIAAFSYGHVAFVEGVSLDKRDVATKTEQILSGYRDEWRWNRWRFEKVRVPVYTTVTTGQVTETYTVRASNRDAYRAEAGVYNTSWKATKTYTERNGQRSNERWNTPRTEGASGLQGYIYRP